MQWTEWKLAKRAVTCIRDGKRSIFTIDSRSFAAAYDSGFRPSLSFEFVSTSPVMSSSFATASFL